MAGYTILNRAAAIADGQARVSQSDIDALSWGFQGIRVLSGCAVTAQGTPDMTLAVAAGLVQSGGAVLTVSAGNVTIGTADATNPRIDLVVATSTGTKAVRAGTAASDATVVAPALTAGDVLLASVYVPANDTAINSNQITDRRMIFKNPSGLSVSVAASNAPADAKAAAAYVCDGTADDVEIQAAIDGFGSIGGTVELSAGDFTIAATLVLKPRTSVIGQGKRATQVTRANGVSGPTFMNFVSTSTSVANAGSCHVSKMRISGSKANVTPANTTTTGTNSQGSTSLVLTTGGGAILPAAPNWVVINYANSTREVKRYTSKSGDTLTLQDALEFSHTTGQPVHHYWAEVLYAAYPTWANTNTADDDYDMFNSASDLWIEQGAWDGVAIYGRSAGYFDHLEIGDCSLRGASVGADTWLTNSNIGLSGHEGVNVSNNAHVMNVAAFYSGNNSNGNTIFGQGFRIEGQIGGHLSNCIAQDNKHHGYLFSFSQGFTLTSCIADSNGALWNGSSPATSPYAGVAFDNATYNSVYGLTCMARVSGFENQKHAIAFLNGNSSTGNQISLTHRSAGYAILAPINPTAGYGTGSLNDLSINNQGGHQQITLANGNTQTLPVPDPYAGGYITYSQAFNGAAVWTLPATTNMHVGVELTLDFVQNATGGGTIVFNAQYLSEGWQPSPVPSSRSRITYMWDGTNWVKKGYSDYEKAVTALRWHEATTAGAWTTSPVNVYTGANGQRQLVNFRGYAQCRLVSHILTTGTVVHRIRVWDGTNVLAQADSTTSNAEQELDTGWISIPAAFLNASDTLLTVQRQITSGTSTGDVHRSTSVYLR